MRNLLLSFIALIMLSAVPAYADPTCESYMPTGCSFYTKGLSYVVQIDPLVYQPDVENTPSWYSTNFSEPEITNLGLTEFVGGTESVNQTALVALLINGEKDLKTLVDGKFDTPTGSTAQYVRGDGSLATLPGGGSRTFNYPSRALNSCFQISSTKDSDFHYNVDVASGTLLSGTITGTVTATSYDNSGCTTDAQSIADGVQSLGASLGILSVAQTSPISLNGTLPAGRWMKITTANTAGSPSFAIRAVQSEVILP